jgi:toxin ParE1/3/4
MTVYRLRPSAEADLANIWRYTAERWGIAQAESYFRTIIATLDALAATPTLGRSCDEIRAGYRRRSVGVHVVFYRIERDHIDIARILHGRMDFERQL